MSATNETLDSQSKGQLQHPANSITSERLDPPLDRNQKVTYRRKDGLIVTRRIGRKAPRSAERSRLLNIRQAAAEYLNVSVWKLRQLVAMGRIEPIQFGANTSPMYFTRESLDKFIDSSA